MAKRLHLSEDSLRAARQTADGGQHWRAVDRGGAVALPPVRQIAGTPADGGQPGVYQPNCLLAVLIERPKKR